MKQLDDALELAALQRFAKCETHRAVSRTDRALTFVQRHPTDDETRHHETLGLLGQLEARQRAMVEQLAVLERKIAGTTGTTP